MPQPPDRDDLVEFARRLTTPVDVRALVETGVLEPRGPWYRRWYAVIDPTRLPQWAVCQIAAMRGAGSDTLVRFARRNVVAEKLHAELTNGGPPALPPAAPEPSSAAASVGSRGIAAAG